MNWILPKFLTLILFFIVGCATSPSKNKRASYHSSEPKDSELTRKVSPLLKSHPGKSGFIPLAKGEEAFKARLVAIKKAERTLDLQYYIWHDDLTGLTLIKNVLEAAERGVHVRLLLDNLNEAKYETGFKILAENPNIEVRLINPHLQYLNHRMHNKSFIADNQIAIVGGRNIGDEYFDASEDVNFHDFDVMLIGPVVDEVSKEFDLYWNSERSFPVEVHYISQKDREKAKERMSEIEELDSNSPYAKTVKSTALDLDPFWGEASVHSDPPEKLKGEHDKTMGEDLRPQVMNAKHELILVSPYFIPGSRGMKILKELKSRGVRIVVLTNSLASNDVPSVYGGYKNYHNDLIKNGIELYELRPKEIPLKKKNHFGSSGSTGLHGKVIIVDRQKMFIGSMNLDARSRDLNTEMGVFVSNKAMAQESAENLLKSLPETAYKLQLHKQEVEWVETKDGKEKTFDHEPETTWWKRTKAWFSSFLVPESIL